jgi:hypothetical protein
VKDHINHGVQVFTHKWYVFWACLELGLSFWRALTHDWTKLMPREWSAYVHQFYNSNGSRRNIRDVTGAYDLNIQLEDFKYAWLSHQKNKHHWQAWISLGDGGSLSPLPIPEKYVREMVADWIGAWKTQGNIEPKEWYHKNFHNIVLHPKTREMIETLLEKYT